MLTAVLTLGGLTLLLALLLAFANRALHVEEDPRIDAVEEMLPHANCGACGEPGCRPFAEALVAGTASPAKCSVGTPVDHAKIAAYLGVDVGEANRQVARLACAGGQNVAALRASYAGPSTCGAAAVVAGGGKACSWGCLGYGDCEVACDFDAIHLDRFGLPVVNEDKCTGCGDCVVACPKDLFSLQPIEHRLQVLCRSQLEGDPVLELCEVACTACGRCAFDSPDHVAIQNGLAVVTTPADRADADRAIQRCPTGAIVWLDPDRGPIHGPEAAPVLRRTTRRQVPT